MYNKGLKGFAYYSHKYVKLQFNRLRHRQDEGLYQWNNLYHMKNDYLCEKYLQRFSIKLLLRGENYAICHAQTQSIMILDEIGHHRYVDFHLQSP